jgi:hypothetical protein
MLSHETAKAQDKDYNGELTANPPAHQFSPRSMVSNPSTKTTATAPLRRFHQ